MLRSVTTAARDGCMLPVKHISRLGVIKPFRRWIPVNHIEVFAVVIRMTFDARVRLRECKMQALAILNLNSNFLVTFSTKEFSRTSGNSVTLGAI